MKSRSRKGFTLVEVIVVLVILALLAAIAIPAMTGWIDKAKEKRLVVACRTCVTAAQTLVVETYGATNHATVPGEGDVTQLAGVPGSVSNITLADTAIATLTYTDPVSSDFVTYTLSPGPKYEFGTGLTVAQAAAKMATLTPPNSGSVPIYGAASEVYPDSDAGIHAGYADFFESLPADIKASLSGKLWTLTRTTGGALRYLYVYEGTYTQNDAANQIKVPVSRYDMTNGSVQEGTTYLGTSTVGTKKVPIVNTDWFAPKK